MTRSMWILPVLAVALSSSIALAHRPSDGFMTLDVENALVSGQLDLAVRDLDFVLGLDANHDTAVTWGEVIERQAELFAYLIERVSISVAKAPCQIVPVDLLVTTHSEGRFIAFVFDVDCGGRAVTDLAVNYDVLFDADAQHRGFLSITFGSGQIAHVFSDERRRVETGIDPDAGQFSTFIREGVMHIYEGHDHMLFLVALLLPAVFFRERRGWVARRDVASAIWETAKVITAFTVAHSLTLALVTLQWWEPPPSRYVEIAIAASILVTAINNVKPLIAERRWVVGFAFGLIHGTGYATVLTDLGLESGTLVKALFGFNLGVELAQFALILIVVPVAFALRQTQFYRHGVLIGGSVATGLFAIGWMIEQSLGLSFMPL